MKKIIIILIGLGFIFSFFFAEEKLLPQHQEWLELVDPIITKIEKEVFFKLTSHQERNRFIQLFWKRRDPLPDTTANEYQKEYMERVRFADRNFGHEAHTSGHLTERGRFYLILGPPLERAFYTTHSDLYPLELWHYKGEIQYGLPSFFYLIFYQDRGIGEYRLYSPNIDGPGKLLTPSASSGGLDRTTAYRAIRQISAEVAGASLSFLPGDSTLGVTSLTSSNIVANIQNLAEKKFSDVYARNFLYYKDFVEVEYSHNYINSNFQVKVFQNAGKHYLHWSIEPSKMNFAAAGDKNYAEYALTLRLEDPQGNRILEREDTIPLNITQEEYQRHAGRIFAFQDILPVIPGNYKLFFLLKNKTGKEFTSFEKDLTIPFSEHSPVLSDLLIYQERVPLPESRRNWLKAFSFSGRQYQINAENNCLPDKNIGLYYQVYNTSALTNATALVEIFSAGSENAVFTLRKPISEVLDGSGSGIDIYPLPLPRLHPGYFQAKVSVLDAAGNTILSENENFIILAQKIPVLPWIYARMHQPPPQVEHLLLWATQFYASGDYPAAETILRQALEIKEDPRAKLLLAQTLFGSESFSKALVQATQVYSETGSRDSAKLIAAIHARLSDWATALEYLERLLRDASELSVLNLAAECYLQLKLPEKALPLLEKSLRIDPNQAKIEEMRKTIQRRK